MKNEILQKRLGTRKDLESQKLGYDKAGDMPYCKSCEFSTDCKSSITKKRCDYGGTSGDFIEVPYPCATAYNRSVRKSK